MLEKPLIAGLWLLLTDLIGIALSKFEIPSSSRFIGDHYAPVKQYLFDIDITEA